MPRTFTAGTLAYVYDRGEFVPVKVLRIGPEPDVSGVYATCRVTADRGMYRKGEQIQRLTKRVIPRDMAGTRDGMPMWNPDFQWAEDAPE